MISRLCRALARSARARQSRRPPRSGLPEFPAPPHSAFIIQH